MFLTFLRLTSFLLAFYISLEHGPHEGHAFIASRLLVWLLGLKGLTCCCLEGLTIAVIAMSVQGVVGCEGTAMGLAFWQNFSLQPFLGTRPVGPPDALRFGLPLALDGAVLPFPFTLRFAPFFSTMTCLMAFRSGSNVRVNLGIVEWLRLYWFCHDIGTDNSTMPARSALLKGIFPFFIVGTALELSFSVGRCLT
jgi:hypothetical protein